MEWGIAAALALVAGGYLWYVTLIKRRNRVREALGTVDVQLQKRYDLLPNILKLAQKFMTHERELMSSLTDVRARVQAPYRPEDPEEVRQHLDAAVKLQGLMGNLFAVAENYPELKSSENVIEAQQTFSEVEANIAAARRFYNSAVTELNNAIEIWPGKIIAGLATVSVMPFFEVPDAAVRAAVSVDDHMR
jgi:LemA protein